MSHELYEGHLKCKRYTFQLFVSNIEGHELRTMTQKYVRQGENIHIQCEAFPWTWYDYRRRLRSASKIFGFPQDALSFQCHFTFLGWRKVMKDRGEYTRKEKGIDRIVYQWIREEQVCCDFDRASSLICGNKLPTRCNRGSYCRSYCLLNMFRASLCPSSGAQKYYTVVPQKLTKLFLHFYSTKYHTQQSLYNTLELLMMGIVMPETSWGSNKICNKNLCCI